MKKRLAPLIVFAVVAAAQLLGWLTPFERMLMDQRFQALPRAASGAAVFVAIDPYSLREIDAWPWPRRHHAALIDRLVGAGARAIAFDVDFSARSTAADDAALANATRRAAGRVILPTFRQRLKPFRQESGLVTNRSLAQFTRGATVAAVDLTLAGDGRVRRYDAASGPAGEPPASIAAAMLGAPPPTGGFHIDYAIRPDSIPVLSYADVLRGDFDPAAVAGKAVIVGAGAIELGDRAPVPVHGLLYSPVVHALAFESMRQDRMLQIAPPTLTLAVGLLLALAFGHRFRRWSWRGGLAAIALNGAAVVGIAMLVQAFAPLSLEIVPWIAIPILCYAAAQLALVESQARMLFRHRMADAHRRAVMDCVVEDSFDGIVVTDSRGNITLLNPAAQRMFGFTAAEAAGRTVEALIPEVGAAVRLAPAHRPAADGEAARFGPVEMTLTQGDGPPVIVEMIVKSSQVAVADDPMERRAEHRRVDIYTFRDVTDQRRVEAALAAKEEAELASRAKSEFLANMSHELRTPLNAVIGFSEVLKDELYGPVGSDRNRSYIADIHASGTHLLQIINDILDIARAEAGEIVLIEEAVDLRRTVATCRRLIAERAGTERHLIATEIATELPDDLPPLCADGARIRQILLALLSNAVKFTPDGGRITIRCGLAEDGGLVLSVADTGIGIAPEDIEKSLQKFGQVESALHRKYAGTGLGLPLVQAFAALHQASLELESAPGEGTVATVRFPAARTLPAAG